MWATDTGTAFPPSISPTMWAAQCHPYPSNCPYSPALSCFSCMQGLWGQPSCQQRQPSSLPRVGRIGITACAVWEAEPGCSTLLQLCASYKHRQSSFPRVVCVAERRGEVSCHHSPNQPVWATWLPHFPATWATSPLLKQFAFPLAHPYTLLTTHTTHLQCRQALFAICAAWAVQHPPSCHSKNKWGGEMAAG